MKVDTSFGIELAPRVLERIDERFRGCNQSPEAVICVG